MSTPDLSIIIVTWNSAADLGPCVESVRAHTRNSFELIVIDNASTDDTRAQIDRLRVVEVDHPGAEPAGRLRVVRNAGNVGYAPAMNQGLAMARGEYIVQLNPDTVVSPRWDERLVAELKPGVGAVGPVSDHAAGLQFFGRFLHSERGVTSPEAVVAAGGFPAEPALDTLLLMGFCLMTSRAVLEAHGPLDPGLTMGGDDLEYSLRLRRAGLTLRVVPSVFVHHKGQASFAAHPAEAVERYRQESVDRVYDRLKSWYGADAVPSPMELWGINWFRPTELGRGVEPELVSIVIPVVGELELTIGCIESIRKYTPEPHEVIVVDNGSTDGTGQALSVLPSLRVLRNERNLGFSGGVNRGIRAARGAEILLLNNDTLVTPGWLAEMRGALHSEPRVGLVGAVSNYSGGVQQVPVSYQRPEDSAGFGATWQMRNAGRIKPTSMLTGLCLLVKREVFDVIGLFDERFSIGNFEDNDFCLRARLANYELRVAEGAFIHHYGSRTFKALKVDYAGIMRENQKRFRLKWGLPEPVEAAAPAAAPPLTVVGGLRAAQAALSPEDRAARVEACWDAIASRGPTLLDTNLPLEERIETAAELLHQSVEAGVEEAAVELRRTLRGFLQQLPPEEAAAA